MSLAQRRVRRLRWVVLPVLGLLAAHLLLLDGLDGLLFSLVFEPTTEYAPGYSWRAFRAVDPGDTQRDVLTKLGPPLETISIEDGGGEVWLYSKSSSDSHYHLRHVEFDREGIVLRRIEEYYVD